MSQLTETLIQAKEISGGGFLKSVPVSNAFDYSKLVPHIQDATDRFLIDSGLVSDDFYKSLYDEIANDVSNYNTKLGAVVKKYNVGDPVYGIHYEELWTKYLMRLLSLGTLYEALPYIELQIGNSGLSSLEGNLQKSAGVPGVKFLRDVLMEKIERVSRKMKEWLCDNKEDFDLYDVDGSRCLDCDGDGDDLASGHLGIVMY